MIKWTHPSWLLQTGISFSHHTVWIKHDKMFRQSHTMSNQSQRCHCVKTEIFTTPIDKYLLLFGQIKTSNALNFEGSYDQIHTSPNHDDNPLSWISLHKAKQKPNLELLQWTFTSRHQKGMLLSAETKRCNRKYPSKSSCRIVIINTLLFMS